MAVLVWWKMSYYNYSSYSDDYSDDHHCNEDSDDESSPEDCRFCEATYKRRNRQRHLDNVHKCPYCPNYMPRTSIQAHIDKKHMEGCSYCNQRVVEENLRQHESSHFIRCDKCGENVLQQNINEHMANRHPFHATIGMICKISDAEFNRLAAEKRIYAKDGHLFVK